jgi:hypothetical protein
MVFIMQVLNETRPEAQRFLQVTQALMMTSLVILAPIFCVEVWGFAAFSKAYYASGRARRERENNRDNIFLRVFLLLQNISAIAVIAQMALPLFAHPWPSNLNCDAFVILVW